jgi:hypothetical protein
VKVAIKNRIWLFFPSAIAGIVFLWVALFGPQTIFYLEYRPRVRHPELYSYRGINVAPRPLEEIPVSTAEGPAISYFGYSFEVPYKKIVRERESDDVEIQFATGQHLTLFDPDRPYFHNPFSDCGTGQNSTDDHRGFKSEICNSKYEQFKAVISATPSQLSPFQSHDQFGFTLALVNQKALWFEHNSVAPDIFSFATPQCRGFEISGVSLNWQRVDLAMFDATDRMFKMRIEGDDHVGVKLAESEIGRIIRTFEVSH